MALAAEGVDTGRSERRGSTRDLAAQLEAHKAASTLRLGSILGDEDKETNSLPRTLLEWKLLRRFKGDESRKSLLHRMVLISKLTNQNFQEVGQYFERVFRDIQNNLQCEGSTGLLLIYPRHCVHVVEGSLDLLLELCRDLKNLSEGNVEQSKLLIISHDIPHRLYQHWSYRVLDIEPPRMDDYDMNESADKLVTEMLTQLLKLGTYLARQPKVSLKNAMDSLHDKVPELLPQQGVIGYLLEGDDIDCILAPEAYLRIYEEPYDVTLDSELTWPMPVKLFPYN